MTTKTAFITGVLNEANKLREQRDLNPREEA